MRKFLEKLENFFSEEENYLLGAKPFDFQNSSYSPYTAHKDKDSARPNIYCFDCSRLELKNGSSIRKKDPSPAV